MRKRVEELKITAVLMIKRAVLRTELIVVAESLSDHQRAVAFQESIAVISTARMISALVESKLQLDLALVASRPDLSVQSCSSSAQPIPGEAY